MLIIIVVECGCEVIVTIPVRGVKRLEGGVDCVAPSIAMRRVRGTLSRSSHRHHYVTMPVAHIRHLPPTT
jgi:hypothetical protein